MSGLEDRLRDALRREDPPEGFAERVLARAAEQEPAHGPRWLSWLEVPRLRWVAAVASLAIVLVAGVELRERREQRSEGERAKQQVMVALRLTASQLQFTQEKVRKISSAFEPGVRARDRN